MALKSATPGESRNVSPTVTLPQSSSRSSVTQKRASRIAPRNLLLPLPDDVSCHLHDGLDPSPPVTHALEDPALRRFELALCERLFHRRDERSHTVRLRLHCHATAIAAAVVARKAALPIQTAYVCGWLHDIGVASCLCHLDELSRIENDERLEQCWPQVIASAKDHVHFLLSRWHLPSSIRFALREHVGLQSTPRPCPLACTTFIAEHVASASGCGFRDEQPSFGLRRCLEALKLTDRDLLALGRATELEFGRLEIEWQSLRLLSQD